VYLAATIAALPYGFTHRDYQSKNLMVRAGPDGVPGLTWIDFQDAMLGPRVYDLVALLMDSYQEFSPDFVEARLREYQKVNPHPGGFDALRYEFDLVCIQRKLKDAGRFIFLDRRQGNSSFLPFVEGSVRKAKTSLERLARTAPELVALQLLISRHAS
jgi:hypothetical protein